MYDRLVQGLRSHQANAGSDWREVIHGRLTLDYSRILQGAKTAAAEEGMGFAPSAYYFIGRCEPEFGDSAVCFSGEEKRAALDAPFDTGGVWAEHVLAEPMLTTDSEKATFVDDNSEAYGVRSQAFAEWVDQNFDPNTDYLLGVEPQDGGFCENVVTAGRSARSWTWEARIERVSLPSSGLTPTDLVLSRRKYDSYHGWVLRNDKLPMAAKSDHINLLAEIYRDPGELLAADYLNSRGA